MLGVGARRLVGCLGWLAVAACGQRKTWAHADAWHTPPAGSAAAEREATKALPEESTKPVVSAQLGEAERLLASRPWAALDDATAARLAGAMPTSPLGATRPYLVRALMLQGTEATGRFLVAQGPSGDTFVDWGCLGGSARDMGRRPIVVALEREPRSVYVTVSMAE